METIANADAHVVFAGDSEMARRCRALDWAATPLGPVAAWPAALRTAVRLMLAAPVATSLWVGESYTLIYNDRYRLILGAKHPGALGRSGAAVWDELWPALEPQFTQVRRGGPAVYEDEALLRMERLDGGEGEDAWFTYALSSLTDDAGECLAVYNVAVETTERVRARASAEHERRRLVETQHELEATNELLQEQAAEMEAQAEELQTTSEELAERTAVAEAAVDRIERLQALTAALAEAESAADIAEVVVAHAWTAAGASAAGVFLRVRGTDEAQTLRLSGVDENTLEQYEHIPLDADGPAAQCLRTGEPVFVHHRDGPEGLLAHFPRLPELWERIGTQAVAVVPLVVAGGVIGALSFTYPAPRYFSDEDRAFFLAVGRQAAQAFERARLFEAERQAAERALRLQRVIGRLNDSRSAEQIAAAIFEGSLEAVGADAGSLGMIEWDDAGVPVAVELVRGAGFGDAIAARYHRFPIAPGGPLSSAILNRELTLVGSAQEWSARFPAAPEDLAALGFEAFAAVPVVVGGRVGAALSFTFRTAQRFDEGTRTFLRTLAEQCALALERQRAHDSQLRQAAQHAALLTTIQDPFVAFDREGRYAYVNPQAEELLQRPAAELIGRRLDEAFPATRDTPFAVALQHALESGEGGHVEALSPTLRRWLEARMYANPGGGVSVVFQDVTDRRRAHDAATFVANASRLLSASHDYSATLRAVAQAAVPALADWCAVDMLDDPESTAWPPKVERVAIVHEDPAMLELAAEFAAKYPDRWHDGSPMTQVVRNRTPVFVPEVTPQMIEGGAQDAEHLRILRALNFQSVIIVPLIARERVLGVLTLCMTESGRHYAPEDLALAEDLGRRAGVAIDTVRLLADARAAGATAQAAAERITRLQHVTALLAGALTEQEVAETVIREGLPAFGASDCVIYLLSSDGRQLELAASAGVPKSATDEFRIFQLSAALPLADVVRTGESLVLETREQVIARYPSLAPANARSSMVSWIALPLQAGDAMLGGMVLGFREERRFSADDRTFAETLARLCAQALHRARLYDEAERARAAAEEANAAKLAFLATMSHELRTPLNAIAGHVQLIDMGLRGPVSDEQHEALDRVNRAQAHLLGLINDILTYAKVESGRVDYHIAPVDTTTLVYDVCKLVEPQFKSKGLTLRVDDTPAEQGRLRVLADGDKLQQIMLNLLSNALKFTSSPGEVSIGTSLDPDDAQRVRIVVRDTGVGIPTAKLESIFEPFVQLGRGLASAHEGTGLGLSISRDLARAMDGDLTVTSDDGTGATFTVTMPRG
jgi:PAS domain S-box-containing protein